MTLQFSVLFFCILLYSGNMNVPDLIGFRTIIFQKHFNGNISCDVSTSFHKTKLPDVGVCEVGVLELEVFINEIITMYDRQPAFVMYRRNSIKCVKGFEIDSSDSK